MLALPSPMTPNITHAMGCDAVLSAVLWHIHKYTYLATDTTLCDAIHSFVFLFTLATWIFAYGIASLLGMVILTSDIAGTSERTAFVLATAANHDEAMGFLTANIAFIIAIIALSYH